ncbi:MAG: N-acetylmuramoyl-L-alanine amidase family protein [Anaerolineae bacterium]
MRRQTIHLARRFLLVIIVAAIGLAGVALWQQARGDAGLPALAQLRRPFLPLAGRQIGIVAGHSGNDAGAVCPDGLTEAQVNMAVAEAVVKELQARGAAVDLLAEFDERLAGYRGDAFVSIHADSCAVELSGYKVAGLATNGPAANGESARLVACLWRAYGEATGLAQHPDTITYDMSRYHAFHEIAATTPAAIIEIGFLKADRELLTRHPERAAAGIVAGIECFLNR